MNVREVSSSNSHLVAFGGVDDDIIVGDIETINIVKIKTNYESGGNRLILDKESGCIFAGNYNSQ
ncbi:MAG: hypothetical protein HRT89_19070 [Lentisphaeria bacterium]|nr:hypothetical protein [Lentisphaeria bacterium]NQZ70160.1 hypothetical protein [Lentisphaeria bacterium]